jgi:lambda family phage portal protein
MRLGKAVDSIIAVISPGWAAKRMAARQYIQALAAYSGADKSRTNRDWGTKQYSADGALVDAPALISRAREAARNHWCASAIIQGYRRHVVGTGILCRSIARDEQGEPRNDFNEHIDWAFNYWASRPELCDIERRKTFVEMQQLIVSELITVGESIVILSYVDSPTNPLRFQVIEPEMLDSYITKNADTGNEVRLGIEIDKYGAPVAYHVHTQSHPLDTQSKSERIPADRVLHLMRQDRVRQTHGCTRLAPVLEKMRQLQIYDGYTLVRARYEAAIGMVIENTNALPAGQANFPSTVAPTTTANGAYEITIEPGMAASLQPGQTAKFHEPTTPGGQYKPFTDQQIYEISAGAGTDFATSTRNFTQGSFSAQRQGKLENDLETDSIQKLVIDLVLRPIREKFVEYEVLANNVEAPGFNSSLRDRSRYLACMWIPPPKPWIDPANQAAAAKIAIDYDLVCRSDVIMETTGRIFTDVIDDIDDEREYAGNLGIIFPEAAGAPVRNSNEPLPGNASPDPAKPSSPSGPE